LKQEPEEKLTMARNPEVCDASGDAMKNKS